MSWSANGVYAAADDLILNEQGGEDCFCSLNLELLREYTHGQRDKTMVCAANDAQWKLQFMLSLAWY